MEKMFSGKRILLAEDNELNRELAIELLCAAGAVVEAFSNGSQALRSFEGHESGYYSLFLTDIQMPVMDGLQTARAIRASAHTDGPGIPIIAVSTKTLPEDITAARNAGINEYLSKPLHPKALYRIMKNYL